MPNVNAPRAAFLRSYSIARLARRRQRTDRLYPTPHTQARGLRLAASGMMIVTPRRDAARFLEVAAAARARGEVRYARHWVRLAARERRDAPDYFAGFLPG